MTKLSLLSLQLLLLLLLVATSLPPTAAAVRERLVSVVGSPLYVECVGRGVYAANSTYEANRHRLAGLLAEAAARGSSYTDLAVGHWPNRLQAFVSCRRRDVDDSGAASGYSCAACVAGAFLEVERACPYHREAFVSSRNCSLRISEFRILGDDFELRTIFQGSILRQDLASGLIFQAIGFGWLFFLLLQEWRSRKRGSMMHSTPLLSGD